MNDAEREQDVPRRDAGNPNRDRGYLQDMPPADAEEHDAPETGQTPAGRAGADSGSAPAVEVTPGSEAESPDEGEHNDIAGVGPRPADADEN